MHLYSYSKVVSVRSVKNSKTSYIILRHRECSLKLLSVGTIKPWIQLFILRGLYDITLHVYHLIRTVYGGYVD